MVLDYLSMASKDLRSVTDVDTTKLDADEDASLDLSLLKELGRSALVNALNSVSRPVIFLKGNVVSDPDPGERR